MACKMLIDGDWVDALDGRTFPVDNPATGEIVMEVPFGSAADVAPAIAAARRALPQWREAGAWERGAILRRTGELVRERVDELARAMTQECGKPLAEAKGEWGSAADVFDWFAEEGKRAYGRLIPSHVANKRMMTIVRPVGVAAAITAWNFPGILPARKWAAGLAAGCTVVGRPSELTPLSSMLLASLLVEAGLPPGVLNLVNGDPAGMGEAFTDSPEVDKISFTGSQRVGSILMRNAAPHFKRLSLEPGGSAPVIVFADSDIEQAAESSVTAKFRNNGQVCISPSRFYVEQPAYEDFLEASVAAAERLVIGNGLDEGVTVGPMVTEAGRDKVEDFVGDALQRGAKVVTGAGRPEGMDEGWFYKPTILTNITDDMRLSCEEVFGPVMAVSSYRSLDDALAQANSTPYGLAGYAITRDVGNMVRVAEELEFGVVGVNDLVPAVAQAPFGGMKQSGFGREGGQEGLQEYLETRFVSLAF
ncbi:MAG: NAD-dependent succinate-semialdehyde dehydrogenase [Anaerolineaceae bacterium]|nr:NAD-dependent succinate-semialdehyde dehydrogenase [Anaerolineaceae bacterium]